MGYIVKGNFNASLFPDFTEAISNARVRNYRTSNHTRNTMDEVQSKKIARILTNKEISDKDGHLIGKGKTKQI